VKLYLSRRAPNPRRVAWFLAEKGLRDLETIDVDLLAGAHKTPEFLKEVGVANVPALILDSGAALTESIAICRYLEALHPEPNLFGRGPEETAVIEMWTRRAELLGAMPMMMAVRHGHPALAVLEKQSPEIAASSLAQAEGALRFFEKRLAVSPWIAADRVTIADGVLFTGLEFARMVRLKAPDSCPHVQRWQADMRARPSAEAGG
jgi:glutathione S-transferase